MNAPFSLILYEISIWAIPAVIAIRFHEASHGYVAHVLGDDTAWRLGRVSFNPLVHIDPFGTVVLPVILPLLRAPFLERTVTVQRTVERTTLVAIQPGGKPWNGLAGKHR
jgi:Zn-dependent protease